MHPDTRSPSLTSRCAPYREAPAPPEVDALPAAVGPRLALVATLLAVVALSVSSASLYVARLLRPGPSLVLRGRELPPEARLDTALESLSRQHARPLYASRRARERMRSVSLPEGSLQGPLSDALRALDASAAERGLWVHEEAGVIRVDEPVAAVDLDCRGTLDDCAARVSSVASVHVVARGAVGRRRVHLALRRDRPAAACVAASLRAEGIDADVSGRTVMAWGDEVTLGAPRLVRAADDETVVAVTAGTVSSALERQDLHFAHLRVRPVQRGGRVVGLRLDGVGADTFAAALGLRDGDVVTHVNDVAIGAPERCLEAWTRLRAADRVTVHLTRGGRAHRVTVGVV